MLYVQNVKELGKMNDLTCIIIGGGYAGLQAFKQIQATTRDVANGRRIRFVLIDKQPGHLRKSLPNPQLNSMTIC
ncbi:hypothetical protein ABES80_23435 [Bacillus gobiensis]|uniref:hypothetical protein n=1 Tax=Bacillus gobiensis TaxID=1441095 RepID=UPI003D22748D